MSSEDVVQYVMHVGICVENLERSQRFYTEALGFKEAGGLEVAGEPTATMLGLEALELHAVYLDREGFRIELLHYPVPGSVGEAVARPMNQLGLTHFALRVDDLEQAVERIVAHGGQVLESTRVHNAEFGSHLVYATDPDGTRLELVQTAVDPTRPS